MAEGHPPAAAVFSVAHAATSWLRGEPETTSASIRLPPDCFGQPCSAALENALHRAGWRLDQADVNHHLVVGPPARFLAELGKTKRKELRRLKWSGATSCEAGLEASKIYDIIAENRRRMCYPITMAWPQVEALAAAFPDRVRFFGVIRGGTILAGAICLRVTASYLYVFYWGERPEFRKESPVILLADGLVAYAQARGISVLDIGVSTEHSAPNDRGSSHFKGRVWGAGRRKSSQANSHPRHRLTPQSGGAGWHACRMARHPNASRCSSWLDVRRRFLP